MQEAGLANQWGVNVQANYSESQYESNSLSISSKLLNMFT